MASTVEKTPLMDPSNMLQRYYASLESRIGYRLMLGGTRHFGYYPSESSFPLPIGRSLRAMEAQMLQSLQCPSGSRVLDAGCGVGHVALYMARNGGYKIEAIDIVVHHVAKAKRNITAAAMDDRIKVRHGDYHNLQMFEDASFDGIYTMETFVHSTDPRKVLQEFKRILKPGGRIALFEYDHLDLDTVPKYLAEMMRSVNKNAAMPSNESFDKDVLKDLLLEAGFQDVRLRDLSKHIVPMLWLFYLLAIIPYTIFKFLGIQHRFVKTEAGVGSYLGRDIWRYIQVTGHK